MHDHLEIRKANEQHREHHQREAGQDREPHAEAVVLEPGVPDLDPGSDGENQARSEINGI